MVSAGVEVSSGDRYGDSRPDRVRFRPTPQSPMANAGPRNGPTKTASPPGERPEPPPAPPPKIETPAPVDVPRLDPGPPRPNPPIPPATAPCCRTQDRAEAGRPCRSSPAPRVGPWAPTVDPDGDCTVTLGPEPGTATILVPVRGAPAERPARSRECASRPPGGPGRFRGPRARRRGREPLGAEHDEGVSPVPRRRSPRCGRTRRITSASRAPPNSACPRGSLTSAAPSPFVTPTSNSGATASSSRPTA